MIKRFLLVVFVSVMLFMAGYSNAQAPQPEEKTRKNGYYLLEKGWEYKSFDWGIEIRRIEKKNRQLKKKTKIQVSYYTNPRQSYAKPYANYARRWFPWGYCTWLVAQKFPVTWRGNANMWITNARAQGYKISNTPKVGSIVQLREGWIGHVAYITNIRKNEFKIIEMNYRGFGIISYRWIPTNYWAIQGYISTK